MNQRCLVLVLSFVCLECAAGERGEELVARSKALAAHANVESHSNAPFRASYDPIPGLLQRDEAHARKPQGACETHGRDLCYDLADRRIVYRPRHLMPESDGLKAESVSLRRNRLTFKDSFR